MQTRNLQEPIRNETEYMRALQELKIKYDEFHLPDKLLSNRIDLAYEVHQRYERLAEFDKKRIREYQIIDKRVLKFLSTVLGEISKAKIDELMADRLQKRAVNPEYIPGQHNIYNPTKLPDPVKADDPKEDLAKRKLRHDFRRLAKHALMVERKQALRVTDYSQGQDKRYNRKMLNPKERDRQRVIIENGEVLIRDKDNNYYRFNTGDMSTHSKPGMAAFTVNMNGEISIFEHAGSTKSLVHSSMNKGSPVLYAGEIKVVQGKITLIGDHSGHYQPTLENIAILLKHLEKKGVNIKDIAIDICREMPGFSKIIPRVRPDLPLAYLNNVQARY